MENSFWIDAHCHLADSRYTELEIKNVIERSYSAQIKGWVQGGVSPEDWGRQREIQAQYGKGVIIAYGLHPWWVAKTETSSIRDALSLLERCGNEPQAIGEVGLDYGVKPLSNDLRDKQRWVFNSQLEIAKNLNKPLILHIVNAHSDALFELKRHAPYPRGGIIHSFSSSIEVAQEYLALGFHLSIGGAVTKKGYKTLKNALSYLPFDKIVVETDSPDQTPHLPGICKEALNEPANLIGIAEELGRVIKRDYKEILRSSTKNLESLFGIHL